MKIREYNNPDRYASPASMKHMVNRQKEMLMRHYKDYKEDLYVLWLVPEMYFNFASTEVSGDIKVITKTGSQMDIPFLVRTPYPNKCIYQLSMKSGKKRLYGIPLVFNSFDTLCGVNEIRIQWNIFRNIFHSLCLDQLNVRYFLSFEEDRNKRFYTLYSRDLIPEVAECLGKTDEYFKEFANALEYDLNALYSQDKLIEDMLIEVSSLKKTEGEKEASDLEKREPEIEEFLKGTDVPHQAAMEYMQNELKKFGPLEMNYYRYYYENSVMLTPASAADIDTASCFGFAEL